MNLIHVYVEDSHKLRKLPALRSLQVFEAAARLKHFSNAGEELCISQSAVSHQIKLLEEYFDTTLFIRKNRSLYLTEKGQQLASELENVFNQLNDICLDILGKQNKEIKLMVFSSFAIKWLIPRMHAFHQLYPEVKIRFEMMSDAPDITRSDADMFITDNNYPMHYWHKTLHKERLIPVCSPTLYNELKQLGKDELPYFPLLAVDESPVGLDWELWSNTHQIPLSDDHQIHVFSHILLAIEAAISGLGVALATDFIVQKDILDGKLIVLDWPDIYTGFSFNLCYKQRRKKEPSISAFSDWLISIANNDNKHGI